MRPVYLIIFSLVALWLGDLFFFNGRYANELRLSIEKMSQDVNYEARRLLRF
jgi:hypothetical protein